MTRPWDSIEKVERASDAFNKEQIAVAGRTLPAKGFFDRCMANLKQITPTEKAAITRWYSSRMRG